METTATENVPVFTRTSTAGPIRLQIAGGDLLLAGRFAHWLPLIVADGKEGEGAVQILFDVTSNRTRALVEADAGEKEELFSFEATEVMRPSDQQYKIKGRLHAEGQTREVEAMLQSPAAHTPFFVMMFRIDKERFPGLWETLGDSADQALDRGQKELRPWAWLRAPQLAAA